MTYAELKALVMFQTNNDAEDLGDFEPHVDTYLNDGYEQMVQAYDPEEHVGNTDYPRLTADSDEPETPEWTHKAIADYATFLVYRNGNPQKQQRGFMFRGDAEKVIGLVRSAGGSTGITTRITTFSNIPE